MKARYVFVKNETARFFVPFTGWAQSCPQI